MTSFSKRKFLGLMAGAATPGLVSAFPMPAIAAAPAKPDQLVMRNWAGTWGDAMEKHVIKAFTEKTGIPVVSDKRPDVQMATLIQAALAQGRQPPVDVFYTLENNAHKDAVRNLMDPLTEDDVPNIKNMLPMSRPQKLEGYPYINLAVDIITLVYRKSAFPGGTPDSLSAIFEPRHKGRVFATASSGTPMGAVCMLNKWQLPEDEAKVFAFIKEQLKPQNPLMGRDPELLGGLQRNEIDVAFTWPKFGRVLADQGITLTKTKEGVMAWNESIWVPKGLPEANRYWAKQFVNFILDADVLQPYCDSLVVPGLRKGMKAPPEAESDPSYPHSDADYEAIYSPPLDAYASNQAKWDAEYESIMK